MLILLSAQFGILELKIFPSNATVRLCEEERVRYLPSCGVFKLKPGAYRIELFAKAYWPKVKYVFIRPNGRFVLEDKLEKKWEFLTKVREFKVLGKPKSVVFLDNDKFVVNLLSGEKCQVFSLSDPSFVKDLTFPKIYSQKRGFVEGLVIPRLGIFLISQMTTGCVHIFSLNRLSYVSTLCTEGTWSKVVAYAPRHNLIFVSNWVSKDVSVIELYNGTVLTKLKTCGIPRGLYVSPNEKYLYVAIFSGGIIQKFSIKDFTLKKNIILVRGRGAQRHIVGDGTRIYVSDMSNGKIHIVEISNDRVIASVKVGVNPNTIALHPAGFLFVSCRGPNSKKGYLFKGPRFGRIFVIDTKTLKVLNWIWGRNQPTGLAVSPDGRFLVFTDFFDKVVEIYKINIRGDKHE